MDNRQHFESLVYRLGVYTCNFERYDAEGAKRAREQGEEVVTGDYVLQEIRNLWLVWSEGCSWGIGPDYPQEYVNVRFRAFAGGEIHQFNLQMPPSLGAYGIQQLGHAWTELLRTLNEAKNAKPKG